LAQEPTTAAFDEPYQPVNTELGVTFNQQMHVIGHDFQAEDLGMMFLADLPNDGRQPCRNVCFKHLATVFGTPYDMVLARVVDVAVGLVGDLAHASSIQHEPVYFQVSLSPRPDKGTTLISLGLEAQGFTGRFDNVWLAEGIFLFFYILGWFMRSIFYRRHHKAEYLEGTMRMCSITDNMTAVAITFLITTITGPLFSNNQQSFSTALNAVLAELPIYGLSLLIVGFYWLSHHRIYMVIRRHNMTLIWLNFGFLLFIEFQPIFNSLHASYPKSQTTTILYASEQAATGLMLLVIWWYAAKGHRLIDKTMDRFEIMTFALRALLVPMIFILSIAIILFRNDLAFYFWLLVIVLEIADLLYRRIRRRLGKEVQAQADV